MPDEQSGLLELGEHAVHRCEPDIDTLGQKLLVDILGRQMPDLALLEQVDDPQPRQRRLEARIFEVVRCGHGVNWGRWRGRRQRFPGVYDIVSGRFLAAISLLCASSSAQSSFP